MCKICSMQNKPYRIPTLNFELEGKDSYKTISSYMVRYIFEVGKLETKSDSSGKISLSMQFELLNFFLHINTFSLLYIRKGSKTTFFSLIKLDQFPCITKKTFYSNSWNRKGAGPIPKLRVEGD